MEEMRIDMQPAYVSTLYKVIADPKTIEAINQRYPDANIGLVEGMYIGDLTRSEAQEARRIFGVDLRPLTTDEHFRVFGRAVNGFND